MKDADWDFSAIAFAVIGGVIFAGALVGFYDGAYLGPMAAVLWTVLFLLGTTAARRRLADERDLPSEKQLIAESVTVRAHPSSYARWFTLLLFCSGSVLAG